MNFFKGTLILVFIIFKSPNLLSQQILTIPDIMKGDAFIGHLPHDPFWSEDGKFIYFKWNPDHELIESLYKVELKGLSPVKVSDDELFRLPSETGIYSVDRTKKLYEKDGDIYLYDIKEDRQLQITHTVNRESDPVFTNHDEHVVFRLNDNLFRISLTDGSLKQLTNFVKGKSKGKDDQDKANEWLENEEMELFEVLKKRRIQQETMDAQKRKIKPDMPIEISLNNSVLRSLDISPDEKFVIYQKFDQQSSNSTKVPGYITESGHTEMLNAREKVGFESSVYSLGVYDLHRDTTYLVDIKTIPGIYDKPEFLRDYIDEDSTYSEKYDHPRGVIFQKPVFNSQGDKVAMVIRSIDNKDRWIMQLNMQEGVFELLDRQRDEAWIGGPNIEEWNIETKTNIGWLHDQKTLWFQSEETGYSHIYTIATDNKMRQAITSGEWEVYSVELSRDGRYFYFTGNKEGPAERHFYRISTDGTQMVRYTKYPGNHEIKISPDEKFLTLRYSYSNQPWELYIMPNKPGADMHKITHSTTPQFDAYSWREPELVEFEARDGKKVHARLYRPESPGENSPAVLFVHGAGYLQNVHSWWSKYYREYLFHNYLVDNGYIVLDIDYRGSEGYGRDWRTGVYRHMGGKDLTDHVDGARFLVEKYNVDPNRIGIYGGSYGGFITIFAMFKFPEVFACGAALRSVTDWAHYNHPYTSNRLNTPVEDSLAFRKSSPIYYAEGLQGELLMLHGVVDTNVHFQDVVRLSQRLIELEKKNWNIAIFPMEDHKFLESSSWTDEYRRIFDLFERNLK